MPVELTELCQHVAKSRFEMTRTIYPPNLVLAAMIVTTVVAIQIGECTGAKGERLIPNAGLAAAYDSTAPIAT